jgi:hypothetical protein
LASVTFVNSKECEVKKTYVKPTVRSRAIRHGDIGASSRFAQKRSVPRYPFAARTVIVEPIMRAEQSTRTSDMSLNGCYLNQLINFLPAQLSGSGSNKVSKSSRLGAVWLTFKKGSEQV